MQKVSSIGFKRSRPWVTIGDIFMSNLFASFSPVSIGCHRRCDCRQHETQSLVRFLNFRVIAVINKQNPPVPAWQSSENFCFVRT